MNFKSIFCTLLAVPLLFVGCKKDHPEDRQFLFCGTPTLMENMFDYFAFGKVYGFCPSNCTRFYKIENGQLFKDSSMGNYNGTLSFATTPLPLAQWQLAMQVIYTFPMQLTTSADSVYGMPDSHDQGTLLIEYKRQNIVQRRYIDPDTASLPPALKPYAQEIESVLSQL